MWVKAKCPTLFSVMFYGVFYTQFKQKTLNPKKPEKSWPLLKFSVELIQIKAMTFWFYEVSPKKPPRIKGQETYLGGAGGGGSYRLIRASDWMFQEIGVSLAWGGWPGRHLTAPRHSPSGNGRSTNKVRYGCRVSERCRIILQSFQNFHLR